ncbi:MAG: hypothetical protein U0869_22715 [Chloroflexota bacterium]
MTYQLGDLAILKQQELLREAAQRRRLHPEKELADTRQRDRKHGVRRLLHR